MATTNALATPKPSKLLRKLRLALNPKQCAFVDHLFSPMKAFEAYKLAYGDDSTDKIAGQGAWRLMHQGPTGEYCQQFKLEQWEAVMMSREEKRAILAKVARTAITDVVDSNGTINEDFADIIEQVSQSTDRDGNAVVTVKLPSKLAAVTIDNQMAGHQAPIQVSHSLSGLLSSLEPTSDLPSKHIAGS
tara:strand:+ start:896 stop:1462 length:567 start_codon:yes stop_codon:yes gene_type:complete